MVAFCLGKWNHIPVVLVNFIITSLNIASIKSFFGSVIVVYRSKRLPHNQIVCADIKRPSAFLCFACQLELFHINQGMEECFYDCGAGLHFVVLSSSTSILSTITALHKMSIRFWPSKYCRAYNPTNPVNLGHIISQWIIAGYILRIHQRVQNTFRVYFHTF